MSASWPAHLTPFWEDSPELWFSLVESYFCLTKLTEEQDKAQAVISYAGKKAAMLISDLISNPDPLHPYSKLKERLIGVFTMRAENRLRQAFQKQLASSPSLQKGLPSQVLSLLVNLNRNVCSDAVVRAIFIEQLPAKCRTLIASSKADLAELGKLADEILREVGEPVAAEEKQSTDKNSIKEEMNFINHKIRSMQNQIDKLLHHQRDHSYRSSRSERSSYRYRSTSSRSSSSIGHRARSHESRSKDRNCYCKCRPICNSYKEHFKKIKKNFCDTHLSEDSCTHRKNFLLRDD